MTDVSLTPPATAVVVEPEINAGRRAFPMAQQLFAGSPVAAARSLECGWYDTSTSPEAGAFALVQDGAGLDDLVGEIVRVTAPSGSSCLVYVLQAAQIPTVFALARRAWFAIAAPSVESAECSVVVIG